MLFKELLSIYKLLFDSNWNNMKHFFKIAGLQPHFLRLSSFSFFSNAGPASFTFLDFWSASSSW